MAKVCRLFFNLRRRRLQR